NLASSMLAAPAAADGIVVAHTLDGRVIAYNLDNGNRLWTVECSVPRLTLRGLFAPLIVGARVYVGLDDGSVLALGLATGQTYWQQTVAVPTGRSELERIVDIDANMQAANGELYAVSAGGRLVSLSLSSGRVLWKQNIASETGLALSSR